MSSIKDPFVEIGAGKSVYREGEAGSEMFLIESGQVELTAKVAANATIVLGPGDFFGEDFLLDGKPRAHTATIVENARLLRLSRSALGEVIAENPEIAIGLIRRLLERLRDNAQNAQVDLARPARAAAPVPSAEAVPAVEITRKPPPTPPAAPAAPRPVQPAPAPPPPAAPPAASRPSAAPPAAAPPSAPQNFALRHVASGELLALEKSRSDFLVGRPDPASGVTPEINLGPFDQNRSLSRRHARILARDGVYFVREDSSTPNGTYVNDERIATGVDVALKLGDRVRFGTIEVELVPV